MLKDCYAKHLLDESEYTMKFVDKSFSDNEYNLILYNDTYKTYSPKSVKINVGDTIDIEQININVNPNKYFNNADSLLTSLVLTFLFSIAYMLFMLSLDEFKSFILMIICSILSLFTFIFSAL